MTTAAIIAEFNPFHNGHAHLLQKVRERGADRIIALMSGDFVQRGEPAIVDRYARAEMALKGGADLVLSYPVRYATSSAERFADAAVRILDALHAVDVIAFGSESGEADVLMRCARELAHESKDMRQKLKDGLKEGLSFPRARAFAVPAYKDLLASPNNILGVEYCKALIRNESGMEPWTFARIGQPHQDGQTIAPYASASAIRNKVEEDYTRLMEKQPSDLIEDAIHAAVPEATAEILTDALNRDGLILPEDFSALLLMRIWETDQPESLEIYQDVTPSLACTILNRRQEFRSVREFAEMCASKSLTISHVSRALLHIALGMRKDAAAEGALLTQVLGFREEAGDLLSLIKRNALIPVIVRPAEDSSVLLEGQRALFAEEMYLANLYEAVRAAKSGRDAIHACSRGVIKI